MNVPMMAGFFSIIRRKNNVVPSSNKDTSQKTILKFGDKVKILSGFWEGQTGTCRNVADCRYMVNMGDVGTEFFNINNLEKIE